MSDEILTSLDSEQKVLEICMNRPERKNALSHAMYFELAELLRKHGSGDDCNAIILAGAQDCFTAGADIKDFQTKRGPGDSPAVVFLRALSQVEIPLIAAVEGYAIGIGTTMLQHCDFVYASTAAKFRLPFIALGLCPEGGSSLLLERIVGLRKSREWLLTCKVFGGQEAFDAGFLSELVEPGQTLERARQTARELAKLPAESIRLTKQMLTRTTREELKEAFDNEVAMYAKCLASESTQALIRGMRSK
ncbi:MAG: enoyl-CoA hydratase-related protein [Burkholderiaceae bacterium]